MPAIARPKSPDRAAHITSWVQAIPTAFLCALFAGAIPVMFCGVVLGIDDPYEDVSLAAIIARWLNVVIVPVAFVLLLKREKYTNVWVMWHGEPEENRLYRLISRFTSK